MAETAKGVKYPKATDFFVYPDGESQGVELRDELIAAFGEKPRELRVIFPLEDEERIASQYYRCYSKTRGLICKGDGEKCTRMVDTASGALADRDSMKVEMREMTCSGRECPDYGLGKCREMMMLQFMLPEISGLGIWQIDTGSINSIRNVNASLDMVRAIYQRIAMVPLVLALEQIEVVNPDDGKKKKVWVMALRSPDNMIAAAMKARMEPLKLVAGMAGEIIEGEVVDLPVSDDEQPDPTVAKDWEGRKGDPIDPVAVKGLENKTSEELVEELYGPEEQERMTVEEAAERMTPGEVVEVTKIAETEGTLTTVQLFEKIAVNKSWKTSQPIRSWLVNKLKIAEDRIDNDPQGVWEEVAKLEGWTV